MAAMAVVLSMAFAAFAASEFDGTWTTKDGEGNSVDVTIGDGKAVSDHPVATAGTVTDEGGSAVIRWTSGWTSVLSKQGEDFVLNSFEKGAPLDGQPTLSSPAQKK